MKATYRNWLEQQKYDASTISSRMSGAARVEQCHGDLDQHYANDRMESLISVLQYSKDDERFDRPNPSKIPFEGDKYNNLASYKGAVALYRKFRDSGNDVSDTATPDDGSPLTAARIEEDLAQRIGLERDMQVALRKEIAQLEPGLVIIDEGAERSVNSGLIDITARDAAGMVVVIELKAGAAGQRAVAQILSYMGDIAAEQESSGVRGLLVASDFDKKAKAAARMVPNLALRRYRVQFQFSDGSA